MYGKVFETMYTGSMVGKGSPMFAVWGYVIANMKPERIVTDAGTGKKVSFGAQVELNSGLLAYILGEKQEVVERVIKQLCAPDPKSRTKEEEGRRLVQVGEYAYRVVNGEHYRKLRNAEERREYQRQKQAEYRAKKKGVTAEGAFVRAVENGNEKLADRILDEEHTLRTERRGPRKSAGDVSPEGESRVEGATTDAPSDSGVRGGREFRRGGNEEETVGGEEEVEESSPGLMEEPDERF